MKPIERTEASQTFLQLTQRTRALNAPLRFALVVLILGLALVTRLNIAIPIAFPFVMFVPAIVVSAALFGAACGIFASVLSGISVASFVLPNPAGLITRPGDIVALLVFIAVGSALSIFIAMLNVLVIRLSNAHEEALSMNARLLASEREKDLLLDELAHRTKNDLQTLNVLLRMQARHVEETPARAALLNAADRTNVVARMHDRLQRRDRSAVVDLARFVADICEDVRTAHFDMRPIALRTDLAAIIVDARRAASIGLILNELITNALKYAFPDDRAGTIGVRLQEHDGVIELSVSDNGVGMSGALPRGSGLGQRLIRALTQELGGDYVIESEAGNGTRCRLTLPALEGI